MSVGETATEQVVETTEPKAQEHVLSKEKTPAEREQARLAFQRRQQQKDWKKTLAEENEKSAREEAVRLGFDPSKDDGDKTLQLVTSIVKRSRENEENLREQSEKEARMEEARAASAVLAPVLKDLGYDPMSDEARILGNRLFKKLGTSNPDAFRDKSVVEAEIDSLQTAFTRKKASDPVTDALISKAATTVKTTESRTATVDKAKSADLKQAAADRGVSEGRMAKILEKEAKIPSFMRRK